MTITDLTLNSIQPVNTRTVLLKLTDDVPLPADIRPGQFVEVRIDDSPSTFLRRPISICFIDRQANELWLLVAIVGEGTRRLAQLKSGDTLNCVLPLGNGFTLPAINNPAPTPASWASGGSPAGNSTLLIGGGVGVAPLLFAGQVIAESAKTDPSVCPPTFLLGARTKDDLLLLDEFRKYGSVFVTTEDGSLGEKGFVTNHSILHPASTPPAGSPSWSPNRAPAGSPGGTPDSPPAGSPSWSPNRAPAGSPGGITILTCGPTPMMKAVARYAHENGIDCQASLENMMACGLGACLCCVEKTTKGNLCVCKDGPVFNTKDLLWIQPW